MGKKREAAFEEQVKKAKEDKKRTCDEESEAKSKESSAAMDKSVARARRDMEKSKALAKESKIERVIRCNGQECCKGSPRHGKVKSISEGDQNRKSHPLQWTRVLQGLAATWKSQKH